MPTLRRLEWEKGSPIGLQTLALIAGSPSQGTNNVVWQNVATNWNSSTLVWGI